MEILIILFVLLAVFVILPALIIFLIVLLASKTLRQKIRALFGVKRENGQIVSIDKNDVQNTQNNSTQNNGLRVSVNPFENKQKVNIMSANEDDITNDFAATLPGTAFDYFFINSVKKVGVGKLSMKVILLPLFDEYDRINGKGKNEYLEFLYENGYFDEITSLEDDNEVGRELLIDKLNTEIYKNKGRYAWEQSMINVQEMFEEYKKTYTGNHSVEGVSVMAEVSPSDVITAESFTMVKDIINELTSETDWLNNTLNGMS